MIFSTPSSFILSPIWVPPDGSAETTSLRTHAQSVIHTGDLIVNLDTKTVEVNGARRSSRGWLMAVPLTANLAVEGITNRPNPESRNARKQQPTTGFLAKSNTCSGQITAIVQSLPNSSRSITARRSARKSSCLGPANELGNRANLFDLRWSRLRQSVQPSNRGRVNTVSAGDVDQAFAISEPLDGFLALVLVELARPPKANSRNYSRTDETVARSTWRTRCSGDPDFSVSAADTFTSVHRFKGSIPQ